MNDKLVNLVVALIERSKAKNVVWNKTNSENEFKVVLDQGVALTIDYYNANYDICVYNRKGELIIRYILDDGDNDFDILGALHSAARESYYKVDETLDNILNELNSKAMIGNAEEENLASADEDDDLPF